MRGLGAMSMIGHVSGSRRWRLVLPVVLAASVQFSIGAAGSTDSRMAVAAKGGNLALTDTDVTAAVDYMVAAVK